MYEIISVIFLSVLILSLVVMLFLIFFNFNKRIKKHVEEESISFLDWVIDSGYIPDTEMGRWRLSNEKVIHLVTEGELVEIQFFTLEKLYEKFIQDGKRE